MQEKEIIHWYLHVDLDAFFASVEQLDHPEYRGKPIIVGGKPEDRRSVVSTASYEARKFGVHSAMPTFQAYKLCPQGIFVRCRMERYSELSYKIMNIFKNYSPDVTQMSIDEAFIDITGTERLFGPPEETAKKIQEDVKNQTGLTVSVGLATTKYLAKIASGFKKPNGFTFIKKGDEQNFMLNLPLEKVWGLGKKSQELLKSKGIKTTKQIFEMNLDVLEFMFGKNMASFLYNVVRGNEKETFSSKVKSHSISAETTFIYDLTDIYGIETELMELAHGVFFRLLKEGGFSRTATVKIRYDDFTTCTVQETVERNIITLDSFFEIIKRLFEKRYINGRGIRLLGVGFENIDKEEKPYQQELFGNNDEKKQAVEKAILKLSKKNPKIKIHKARTLKAVIAFAMLSLTPFCTKKIYATEQPQNVFPLEEEKVHSDIKKTENDVKNSTENDTKSNEKNDTKNTAENTTKNDTQNNTKNNTPHINTVTQKGAAVILPENENAPSKKEKNVLFDWKINDKNKVDFSLSGFWKINFLGSANISFSNRKTTNNDEIFNSESSQLYSSPVFSWGTPVFKQEVNFSFLSELNNQWFVQGDFIDNFQKNTFAIGYHSDGFLKSVRIANRNITFSTPYSADFFGLGLKGGENQSPGIAVHLESPLKKWEADAILRYDMTDIHSKTFYGMNKVSDTEIDIQDFLYGREYIFPDGSKDILQDICDIFVENLNGVKSKNDSDFTDSYGRKYLKLSKDDYRIFSQKNQIVLLKSAGAQKKDKKIPSVIITFYNQNSAKKLSLLAGSFSDRTSFLGKIQEEFNMGDKKFDLSKYYENPQEKNIIDGKNAFSIQTPSGFSPFVCPNVYDLGLCESQDMSIISGSTQKVLEKYTVYEDNIFSASSAQEDFFSEKNFYAKVFDFENKSSRYPFVQNHPQIYLNIEKECDEKLLLRSYSSVKSFEIGPDAASGTVLVYKNDILDTNASYDSKTGIVTLGSSVSQTDKIYIVWQEDSSNFMQGNIAAGTGFKMNFTEKLQGDIFAAINYPVFFNQSQSAAVSNIKNIRPAFAAITTGITYKNDFLSISDKTAFSLKKDNACDTLIACEQNDSVPKTYYLDEFSGYETKCSPIISTDDDLIFLEEDKNRTIKNHKGFSDSKISGSKIPLSFKMNEKNDWASVDIKLKSPESLKKMQKLFFALKAENISDNFDIFLQLGVNAENTFSGEDSKNLPCWKIDELNYKENDWQTVSVILSDEQRSKLSSGNDARFIIIAKNDVIDFDFQKKDELNPTPLKNDFFSGTLWIGPYEPNVQSIFTDYSSDLIVYTTGEQNIANGNKNYSSIINWKKTDFSQAETSYIKTVSYFQPADFSSYSEITLDFALETLNDFQENDINDAIFSLLLENSDGSEALNIELKKVSTLFSKTSEYHSLKINKKNKTIEIDGFPIAQNEYSLKINEKIIPSVQKITLEVPENLSSGRLYIGNLNYIHSDFYADIQNNVAASIKKDGIILSAGNIPLLKNAFFETSSTQSSGKIMTDIYDFEKSGINTNATAKITSFNINFQNDASFSKNSLENAGQKITSENPLFGFITFDDSYRFSSSEKSLNKSDLLQLDFSKTIIPVKLLFNANAQKNLQSVTQNSQVKLNYDFKNPFFKAIVETKIDAKQKTLQKNQNDFKTFNYFSGFYEITKETFSEGNEDAQKRNTDLGASMKLDFPTLNFAPKITFGISSNYAVLTENSFGDTEKIEANFPLSFSKNMISLNVIRKSQGYETSTSGGNYFSDIRNLFEIQKERGAFYGAIPFYELFDKNLAEKNNSSLSSQYEIQYKRKLSNNMTDLFAPTSASFAVLRNLNKSDILSESYQLKASAMNNSVNNFGSSSANHYFDWFKMEEITTSITGIVKIPTDRPENTTFLLTSYAQLMLFINDDSVLSSAVDLSLETDGIWATRGTLIFTYPGKTSPFIALFQVVKPKLSSINFSISRKDTFNVEISNRNKTNNQNYAFKHSADYSFLKYFSINLGLEAAFSFIQNSKSTVKIEFSVGGKAQFQ